MPVTQATREVSVTSPLGTDVLLFDRMSGSERLGRLFEYRVQLLSTRPDLEIAGVLGKTMGVHLNLPSGELRHFNGIVTRFASAGWHGSLARYEATLRPSLWLLTRSSNCRIFQDMSVLDIVKAVCQGDSVYGGLIDLDTSALSGNYETMTYCVQYRETDFNFVSRLLEEAGIYYYFEHYIDKHTMVLSDSYGAHQPLPGYASVLFSGEEGRRIVDQEAVYGWAAGGEIQSSVYVLDDFDFEKAGASTSGGLRVNSTIPAAFDQQSFEMYDYPGRYALAANGTVLARGRMESLHGQCEEIVGDTNARGLSPGGLFKLENHPREDQNREFLVTASQLEIVGEGYASGSETPLEFKCVFHAVGKEHGYRPPRVMARPVVQGPQTAMVVGKAGEEVWTDKYGRIKVQFHWDRDGKHNEESSCWVRVQQAWAGAGWGSMFIPRVGMEVVVSFLEGDPDRPLVTGCVYNSDAMPPYELPAEQTRSTIKSNTSKGGAGFNEIRFEDKTDAEEIFVQAEKDFLRVVKNNDVLKVGFEKKDKGDQTITIMNDRKLDVGGDQTTTIKGDQKVTVSKTIVIEASTSIELKVGASSIKIEGGKITVKSAEIEVAADANAKVKAGAMMDVKAGGVMTIEGALVKIN